MPCSIGPHREWLFHNFPQPAEGAAASPTLLDFVTIGKSTRNRHFRGMI